MTQQSNTVVLDQPIADEFHCPFCRAELPGDRRLPCKCGKNVRERKAERLRQGGGVLARAGEHKLEGEDLVVIASDPQEMVGAQHQMIENIDAKIVQAQAELQELQAAAEGAEFVDVQDETARQLIAQAQERLKTGSRKIVAKAERRVVYLQKVRAALAAGYVMMPNMPGHVIAVRTGRKGPPRKAFWDVSSSADADALAPDPALPPGEGKYVSPIPLHTHEPEANNRQNIMIDGFDEEIGLPVEFLKPAVVQRTAKAIDLKIFDEIVLVRDSNNSRDSFAKEGRPPRGRDPLVVGRVILRTPNQKYRYEWTQLSFLIAWFMDTAAI